jgi:hypothetical protein
VRDDGWHRLSQLEKVVFSRSLTEASWSNTRICSGDLVEDVRAQARSDVPLHVLTLAVSVSSGVDPRCRRCTATSWRSRSGSWPPAGRTGD